MQQKIGYILKVYPRYSETFILNEILAHERANLTLEIFSLRPPTDGLFHDGLARVRNRVTYLDGNENLKASELWQLMSDIRCEFPSVKTHIDDLFNEDSRDVYQGLLLAREIRKRQLTHLHAHFGSAATTVARIASRIAGINYSFTAHAKDIFHNSVRPDDLRRKLNEAAFVITVSKYNLQYLQTTFGKASNRVICVYNGINLNEFMYQSPANRQQRIVAVGRLVEKKGFKYLIEACKLLHNRGKQVAVDIIGGGEQETSLKKDIERHALEGFVRLLGPRPQSEVKQYVQQAAAIAVPCVIGADGNREGLPTIILEAMALGTPCVSTDVTGIPEVLQDGVSGLQVPQGDSVALANALERLLDDRDLREKLAVAARRLIEKEFEIDVNTGRIRAYFEAEAIKADAAVDLTVSEPLTAEVL